MFDLISILKFGIGSILFSTFLFYCSRWSKYKSGYLEFLEKEQQQEEEQEQESTPKEVIVQNVAIFEHKYLEKYNKFPNQYYFSYDDILLEKDIALKITNENKQTVTELADDIQTKLDTIQTIIFGSNTCDELGNKMLRQYFELDDESDDGSDEDKNKLTDHQELFVKILAEQTKYQGELDQIISKILTADEIQLKAREALIEHKLNNLMDSYVLESTPLGNVYMRYNNSKKSFEYFSNNSIPYRFLETIGRKYVVTFWCKPIFVNLEEELEKAKLKYEEENKQPQQIDSKPVGFKPNIAKTFNKDIKMAKNRGEQSNFVLPPNIKPNLVDVKTNESHLLKENANRYTWEGRISCFCPLKQIDKKIVNKNLNLSFAAFKKMNEAK